MAIVGHSWIPAHRLYAPQAHLVNLAVATSDQAVTMGDAAASRG
jgi:hypothetical protein